MAGRPFGIYLLGIHGQRNREGPENLRMIVVTGGAGFIGSNIVAALSERGEDGIVVSDRLESEEKRENLRKHAVREVIAPEALEAFLGAHASRLRAVIHMGAITSTTETDAALLKVNNIDLSTSLWRWCAEHEIPFIYASSAATYGDGSQGFDDTLSASGLARLRPLNAYARSKHIFDRWMHRRIDCGASRPPQWVGLKFFNVYGPNEYHKGEMKSVVAKAYRVAASGGAVKLFRSHHPGYPDGGQKRDFVYVADCAAMVLWLLDHPGVSGLFNAGTGRGSTWSELIGSLFRALGEEPRIEFVEMPEELRDRYQYRTEARMQKLRAAGYDREFHSVEEGVADYVRNYLATGDPYR